MKHLLPLQQFIALQILVTYDYVPIELASLLYQSKAAMIIRLTEHISIPLTLTLQKETHSHLKLPEAYLFFLFCFCFFCLRVTTVDYWGFGGKGFDSLFESISSLCTRIYLYNKCLSIQYKTDTRHNNFTFLLFS